MRWPAIAIMIILLALLAGPSNASSGQGHFTVTDTTGSPPVMDDARFLAVMERAYGQVNGTFGTCPGHVEVIVVDDKAMDEEAGEQVDSFSAWNKMMSAMVLRQAALKNNTSLPVVAAHEMTHLAINEILCKKDPREFHWMEEGVCTLVSKEPLGDADVAKYIVGHGFLDTAGIQGAIKSENCTVSKNGYMQSYGLVKYMAKRYGLGAVINMLESPEKSLDKAFRQSTGEDFPALYEDWKKDVRAAAN